MTFSSRATSRAASSLCPISTIALSGHADTVTTRFGSFSSFAEANASDSARRWTRASGSWRAATLNAWHRNHGSLITRASSKAIVGADAANE
jgi:hypothetical protein